MDLQTLRTYLGLGTDVISDEALAVALQLAEGWCDATARAYGSRTVPDQAVVMMALFYLRQNLDIRGIKPSTISLPDMSMATDVTGACIMLRDEATTAIKREASASGAGFRHIRSGKVRRWS